MATASGGASALVLTEEDIRGASLNEPLDKHTISELRWWLLTGWEVITADNVKHEFKDSMCYVRSVYL